MANCVARKMGGAIKGNEPHSTFLYCFLGSVHNGTLSDLGYILWLGIEGGRGVPVGPVMPRSPFFRVHLPNLTLEPFGEVGGLVGQAGHGDAELWGRWISGHPVVQGRMGRVQL